MVVLAIAIAGISSALDSEWVLLKNIPYDPMPEEISLLRTLENPSQSAITAPEISYLRTFYSSCWGAESQTPPWTSPFSAIFNTPTTAWYATSGTASVLHIRSWILKVWNTGGEQKWMKSLDGSTYERTRVDRDSPWIYTFEVPMVNGGGGVG